MILGSGLRVVVWDDKVPDELLQNARDAFPPCDGFWVGGSRSGIGPLREGRPDAHAGGKIVEPIRRLMQFVHLHAMRELRDDKLVLDLGYAGAFQMLPGRALSPHRDMTSSRLAGHVKRWAVLVFLNHWRQTDGGYLEFWGGSGPELLIPPLWGRVCLFSMGQNAWHGVSRSNARRLAVGFHMAAVSDEEPTEHMEWWEDHRGRE